MVLFYCQVEIIKEGNVTTVVALDDARLHIGSIEPRGCVDMGKKTNCWPVSVVRDSGKYVAVVGQLHFTGANSL